MGSILDSLLINLASFPEREAYVFHINEDYSSKINFKELEKKVNLVASKLSMISVISQARILIILPPSLEFIVGFLGCLAAGMIAVPTFPPKNSRKLDRLKAILNDCTAKYVLSSKSLAVDLTPLTLNAEKIIYIEDLLPSEETIRLKVSQNIVTSQNIAFLQYTSGSTGEPKGVCISHENIINNLGLIENAIQFPSYLDEQRLVSWLPPYHDMGLIFGILFPLFKGITCHFITPQNFIKSPYNWLKLISDVKATITGAPNFAFDLCTHVIPNEKLSSLNLSSLQVIFNGAEPINPKTIENFLKKFSCTKISQSVFYPAYGLAESTLFVSSRPNVKIVSYSNATGMNRTLVSCGYKGKGHDIKIIDPYTLIPCKPYKEGEIWIRGPSVARGYWNKKELTDIIFQAKHKEGEQSYLRTGDLGFFDNDGELYVSGRIKDIIIINGQNIYPQDIETLAQISHPSLALQKCVAFSISALEKYDHELLIIIQEVHRHSKNLDLLENLIRKAITESYDIPIHQVVFVCEKSIPITTSGKIQRQKCKELFLKNKLQLIATKSESETIPSFSSYNKLLNDLHDIISSILNKILPKNFYEKTLLQLGFDSIKISLLMSLLEEKLGIESSFSLLFSDKNLSEIIEDINKTLDPIHTELTASTSKDSPPLASLSQQKLWFLNSYVPHKQVYNIPVRVEIRGYIKKEDIERTLQRIIDRHEVLRSNFEELEELILLKTTENLKVNVDLFDLFSFSPSKMEKKLRELEKSFSDFEFDLEKPGLFNARLIRTENEKYHFLLNFHHIIFDGYSLKLFLQEFSSIFNAINKSQEILLPNIRYTYRDFSNAQRKHLSGDFLKKQISFWKTYLEDAPYFSGFSPKSTRSDPFTYKGTIKTKPFPNNTAYNLVSFTEEKNVTTFIALLAAYYVLLFSQTGQTDLIVGVPISGRAQTYTLNVIGLVMNILPIRLILNQDDTFEEILFKVNKVVRNIQDYQYIPFDILIEHLKIKRILDINPLYQTLFTLREDWNSALILEGFDTNISEISTGYVKLDLSFYIQEKRDSFDFQVEYAEDLFTEEEISVLMDAYLSILNNFIKNPKITLREFLKFSEQHLLRKGVSYIKNTSSLKKTQTFFPMDNEISKKVYVLWSELLGKEDISVDDNFFQLGGHSLLLNRMILRLKKDFGYKITIRDAFANPTIASLSNYIKRMLDSDIRN